MILSGILPRLLRICLAVRMLLLIALGVLLRFLLVLRGVYIAPATVAGGFLPPRPGVLIHIAVVSRVHVAA